MKYLFSVLARIALIVLLAASGIYLFDFTLKRFYPRLEKDTSVTILIFGILALLALAGYFSGVITRAISKGGFVYTLLPITICGFLLFVWWATIMKDTERIDPLSILIVVVIFSAVLALFGKRSGTLD